MLPPRSDARARQSSSFATRCSTLPICGPTQCHPHWQALDLFDDLVASNLAPNQATLSALAAAHARAGDWQRVGGVLRHMGAPSSGAPPSAATYAPLFRCGGNNRFDT
jgi:hypothetical protein